MSIELQPQNKEAEYQTKLLFVKKEWQTERKS